MSPLGAWAWRWEARLYSYSESWSTMDTPTYWYGLTIYDDHLVLVGGVEYPSNKLTNKIWLLQSLGEDGKEEWKEDNIPPMPTRRHSVSAVGYDKLLLVAGGQDENNQHTDLVELYQPGQWRSTTPLPRPCSGMSSTVMGSHVVFAGGEGQCREVYHCSTDTIKSMTLQWERLADAPLEYSSIITLNGVLLAIGGRTGSSESAAMFGFSAHTRSWHHFFNLPLPLFSTSTAVTQIGQIVAVGGLSDSLISSRVFKLYIKSKSIVCNTNQTSLTSSLATMALHVLTKLLCRPFLIRFTLVMRCKVGVSVVVLNYAMLICAGFLSTAYIELL